MSTRSRVLTGLSHRDCACSAVQLGHGNTVTQGDVPSTEGETLPFTQLGTVNVTDIRTGGFHACVIIYPGAVKCWGDNQYGQLGMTAVTCPPHCHFALNSFFSLFGWCR